MKSGKPLWYITVTDKKTSKSEKYEFVGEPTNRTEKELKEKALEYFKLKNNSEGFISSSIFVGYTTYIKEMPKIKAIEEKSTESNIKISKFRNKKKEYNKWKN